MIFFNFVVPFSLLDRDIFISVATLESLALEWHALTDLNHEIVLKDLRELH